MLVFFQVFLELVLENVIFLKNILKTSGTNLEFLEKMGKFGVGQNCKKLGNHARLYKFK